MKRFLFWILVITLPLGAFADVTLAPIGQVSPEPMLFAAQADCSFPLIAGQHTEVGEVLLDWTDDFLVVTYLITVPEWQITEVHFGWFDTPVDYAIPGQLQRKYDRLSTQSLQFKIPRAEVCPEMYFAAHAAVEREIPCTQTTKHQSVNPPGITLPNFTSFRAYLGGSRAMYRLEMRGEPPFNRNGFNGWCLDRQAETMTGEWINAQVHWDWDDGYNIVDRPENMHAVEWLIEQNFVGREIVCGKIVTRMHVQRAIWYLIDFPTMDREKLGCVPLSLARRALNHKYAKSTSRTCWGTQAIFAVQPLYTTFINEWGQQIVSPPNKVQPMVVDLRGNIDCPTPTSTPTPQQPTPTPTPRLTKTPKPTPTVTPTGTPPTVTPTYTPTSTPTCSPTPTPTPTPCTRKQSETAWAMGSWAFTQSWGWVVSCE